MTDHDDELLRSALHAEAEGVNANDDLLDRIHAASSTPRSTWAARAPWLLAVAALAVVVGIAAAVLGQDDGDQSLDVIDDPTTTTTEGPELPPGLSLSALCQDDAPADVQVHLHPGVSDEALAAMAARLGADPRVASAEYRDQEAVYAEFRELFADSPELLDTVTPDILPSRYELTLQHPADRDAVKADLEGAPGVYEIVDASEVCGGASVADRPAQAVALTVQGRIVVIDTATGDVIRDLGGFDDPTDPAVAEREGGPFSITGVALHPNGQDVYFETCCEPAAGSIFRIPIDGSVSIGDGLFDAEGGAPVAYGYGIDISTDGRWLTYVHPGGVTLHDLETGDTITAPQTNDTVGFVQAAVNHDGTEVTVERALERGDDPQFYVVRSELITYRRVGNTLERTDVQGGDIRLLPVYVNGELAQVAARDGVIDVNVDASGRWFLATPADRPLRGYTQATDEQEIPGGPYLAADW